MKRGLEKMKNLILIGMPASGKSTVGVVVAKRIGYEFVDTDLLIQKQEKRLLKDIIETEGNARFLEIENQVNLELDCERAVISPGGSVVYCEEAMQHFKEIGTIVYLKVSFEEIQKRISNLKGRGVVLREGQSFLEVYEERTRLFEKYADYTVVEHGNTLDETIEQVLDLVEKIGG